MKDPTKAFRRRLSSLVALLILAIAVGVSLAVLVTREANGTLRRLASVELEAAKFARQFRTAVDDLRGTLLHIGTDSAEHSATALRLARQRLTDWLAARETTARSDEERAILQRLSAETTAYFEKLNGLVAPADGLAKPLDHDTIQILDDSMTRLQGMADDFAAVHDERLRDLLQSSLGSVHFLRNLVFVCLVLLLAAITFVTTLLYRDVVRPLRQQLVEHKTLLLQHEKLAALGTLAAGVAHEIRNPLTAIRARLYTLRRSQTATADIEDVESIQSEVDRLERIVSDVLGYARPADPAFGNIELGVWLRDFASFIEGEVRAKNIDLPVEVPVEATVRADADQLRQVMLNLVRNAEEALQGRPGRIALSLRREQSELRGKTADVAILTVTDNGPGISTENQSRLFDPFFTTKPAGTGLGLSIVARLVENHGGEIIFQTAPGTGTRFSVRLPICGSNANRRNSLP